MTTPDRVIFHCDCNSFFASVEEVFHPEYRAVPMAIGGDPAQRRGIVVAKNELAKSFGIKTTDTIWKAKQKCPELVICPPRHHAYDEFCQRINTIYEQYTDLVERCGIDESFLDVTGSLHLFGGNPVALAHEIRQRVEREIGLTISVGVSWNRIFAKLGSDLKKPNAVSVLTRENYQDVVWPLPACDLFLVGKQTAATLEKHAIRTIGDLARTDAAFLQGLFGKFGQQLHINANGLDDSPVDAGEQNPAKSMGNGMTFRRDLLTANDVKTGVTALADWVATRLRQANLQCGSVQVTMKDTTLHSIQRQKSTDIPTHLAADLTKTALEIIHAYWKPGKPLRQLTITAQNLTPVGTSPRQLSLLEEQTNQEKSRRTEKIEQTMDQIRGRFGHDSILSGRVVGNDLGIGARETDTPDADE